MSKNTFKYNKKRKHYSYIFGENNNRCKNILLTTKALFEDKKYGKKIIRSNIPLAEHPNPSKKKDGIKYYLVNHQPYFDDSFSFDSKVYSKWKWNPNDKRKIKRFKKYSKYKKFFDDYGK